MKFIINSQVLSRQLQLLSGVLTNNNTVPIINCFHFHIDEGMLTVRATDLETTLVSKMEVETGDMEGLSDIAVPSRLLLDTLKSLEDVPLQFLVDDGTYAITIVSGEGKYRLAGKNAETFPTIPEERETSTIVLPGGTLVNAIGKTAFAASTDELRQQMSGIFCDMGAENITFVATDAHKLVRYRRTDIQTDTPVSFILPRKPVSMVRNILATLREDLEVTVAYNNTNVFFTFDNFYIVCRLVEGKYPNYEAAIPKENPNRLTIDRMSFLNVLRRVGLFANKSTHQVRLSIQEHGMDVSAEDIEFANDAHEKMPCEYEGEPMAIGFNAKFLTEMLSNLETEQVMMELSHPSRAGIIFPINNDEENHEDILMLVMPVMLAN